MLIGGIDSEEPWIFPQKNGHILDLGSLRNALRVFYQKWSALHSGPYSGKFLPRTGGGGLVPTCWHWCLQVHPSTGQPSEPCYGAANGVNGSPSVTNLESTNNAQTFRQTILNHILDWVYRERLVAHAHHTKHTLYEAATRPMNRQLYLQRNRPKEEWDPCAWEAPYNPDQNAIKHTGTPLNRKSSRQTTTDNGPDTPTALHHHRPHPSYSVCTLGTHGGPNLSWIPYADPGTANTCIYSELALGLRHFQLGILD